MRVATWNVNSLRVRLTQVVEWLTRRPVDLMCLQETKLTDQDFPAEAFTAIGYHAAYTGQKTYNGVAILSREPLTAVESNLPGADESHKRFIAGDFKGVRIVNVYVPNGEAVDSPKYAFKLQWLAALERHLRRALAANPRLILVGDFNVAPEARDVHDPAAWEGKVLFSEPERQALGALLQTGLSDVFRKFDQPAGSYSWWDYRQGAFRRNHGLRIDLVLASDPLAGACRSCGIDVEPRRADRPSDHAPVVAEFDS